ncbi:hypothetical protein OPV22_023281 [Ensete ventricosum]|uniref:Uncharacterized protein n=1 Tax=Ensete ventricosum TaxID=4639 RepID=A0AAV8QHL1_ENSVE|nr:hypothetical protein OPV22_023281 [Ensete ventricosum]
MYMDAPSFSPAKVFPPLEFAVCLLVRILLWLVQVGIPGAAGVVTLVVIPVFLEAAILGAGFLADNLGTFAVVPKVLEIGLGKDRILGAVWFLADDDSGTWVVVLTIQELGIPGAVGFLADDDSGTLVVVLMFLELGLGEDGIPGAVGFLADDDSGTLVVVLMFLELGLGEDGIPGAVGFLVDDDSGTLGVVLMSLEHGLGGDEIVEAGFLAEELGGCLVVVPMVLELGLGEDGIPGFLVDDDDSGTLVPQWSFRAFRFARLMMMGFEKLPELIPVAVALELLSMGWKAERVSSEKKSVVVVVLERNSSCGEEPKGASDGGVGICGAGYKEMEASGRQS